MGNNSSTTASSYRKPADLFVGPDEVKQRVSEYETLLYRIAYHFDYNDREVADLISNINAYAVERYDRQESGLSLKLWLSKMMVHKCIRSISSNLFSQESPVKHALSGYDINLKASHRSGLKHMPLSYRAVYILHDILKFSELEIAGILNTDIAKVKARRTEAIRFIKAPTQDGW